MSVPSQSESPLWEAFELIGSTTVLGVLYGITFTLYCLCARSLYPQLQEPDKRWQARFTLAYTSLVLVCATTYLALSTRMAQFAYIDRADSPGGPLGYGLSSNPTTKIYVTTTGTIDLMVEVLTVAIQIWRLWVIWSGTRYAVAVTILPVLLLFAFIALDVQINIIANVLPLDKHGFSDGGLIAMDIVCYSVLSMFTILVTGLVIGRILLLRRRHIKLMGMSDISGPYMSIAAMLIESYALDSAWSIASAISSGLKSPTLILFVTSDSTVKVIAYFLVAYRVTSGRAWTRETGHKLTTIQWNHGTQTATDEASSIRSRVPATKAAVVIGSLLMSQPEPIV